MALSPAFGHLCARPTARPARKAFRGSSYVPSNFSRNHSPNSGRDLARPWLVIRASGFILTTNNCQYIVRAILALMSLTLAVSCTTQSELAQSPPAPSAVAPRPLLQPETRAHPSKAVRASYQGDAYAGHRTASGERYDPNALTAASSTLPIGSTVMVTNPATGHSVKVRVNDRGPNVHGRSLDLSKRAAEEIGITKQGVARVTVKRVESKPAGGDATDSPESSLPVAPPKS